MKSLIKITAILLVLFILQSCSEDSNLDIGNNYKILESDNPKDKHDRLFGINISESKFGFAASFDKATEAGVQIVELNLPWTMFEAEEGVYSDPDGLLGATAFYGNNTIKVGISLAVINTVKWEIPGYLSDVDVKSDKFVLAFNNMADWVISQVPDNVDLEYLSIGNEIDLVLSSDAEWEDYTSFFQKAAAHIRTTHPEITIGVKTTVMHGLFGGEKDKIQLINRHSDVVMLNYNPQNERFQVLDPEIIHQHFGEVVTAFPNKDVWITEIGYQSGSEYCASTETKQAHFFHQMFEAWDKHDDKIKLIVVDWLYDQSPELIEEWKDYYGSDPALVEYLSTLGLLNHNGTEKNAWKQVLKDTEVRGWR